MATRNQTLEANLLTVAAAMRKPTLSVGAEAIQAITITLSAVDGLGAAVAVADLIQVEVFTDSAMSVKAVPANFTLTDGGSGTRESVGATVTHAVFQTTTAGALQVKVTDVSGVSAETLHVRFTYLAVSGVLKYAAPFHQVITFTA